MVSPPTLDSYYLHERDWESYDELVDAFDFEVPNEFNAAEYICDRWADDKARVALFAEDYRGRERTFTFWRLRTASNRLANVLETQGIGRGDRIAVHAAQKPETLVTFLAAWKLGAVAIPMSTLFGPDALSYRIDDADVQAFVADSLGIEEFREAHAEVDAPDFVLTVDVDDRRGDERDFWDALDGVDREFDTVATAADDDATIIYTSGTTGDPKGTVHTHSYVLGNLPPHVTMHCNLKMTDLDLSWSPTEWAWGAALYVVLFPSLFFGQPVLAYERKGFDAERALALIEKYGVTKFNGPRTMLRMVMDLDQETVDRYDLSSVRVIPSGGESVDEDTIDWVQDTFGADVEVHEAYGQTEALGLVGSCNALFEPKPDYIGRPFPGQDIEIVDTETAEPVESGEIGEIAVRHEDNPVIFKEYLNKPEQTAEKFSGEWMLTEDLGRMDEDGYVTYEGRKDDVIICSGYRISPKEMEQTLASHEAVVHVAVIGVPDDDRGEIPKAFVELAQGYDHSDELRDALVDYVRDRLAKYEYPRAVEFLPELPKTSSDKIRKSDLREREPAITE